MSASYGCKTADVVDLDFRGVVLLDQLVNGESDGLGFQRFLLGLDGNNLRDPFKKCEV